MKHIKIARNAVTARLLDPDDNAINIVNNLLSYKEEGYQFGGFSGRCSFFEILTNKFPAGFVSVVQSKLRQSGYNVMLIEKPIATPLGEESPIVDEFGNDNPDYDFQMQALHAVERHGAGIIQVATGGGKSKIAKLILKRFNRTSLFLTTRGILLYQMSDQLDELGMKTGQIGDGEMKASRGVNLGMVQTLVQALEEPDITHETRALIKSNNLKSRKAPKLTQEQIKIEAQKRVEKKTRKRDAIIKFLSMIEVVVGEEAHEAGGNSYYEILKHCKNASIRVALTATPFMKDNAASNMRLMAAFGPILIKVSEETLINRGILAKPYFMYRSASKPEKLHRLAPFQRGYELGYVKNTEMHKLILADALRAKSAGMPILTLVSRKAHGETLCDLMRSHGMKVEFLKGENDQDQRKAQLNKLANGEIDAVIGTTILDVGVDVPALCLVQLCGGMKAEVSLRQRIGRGLRRKSHLPNVTFVIDYSCDEVLCLRDHARMRKQIVENTPGFVEGIITKGDLPWYIFEKHNEAA